MGIAAALAWNFLPHPGFAATYLVALLVPLVPCGIYCGLVNFTRPQDFRFFALFLIVGIGSAVAAALHGVVSPERGGGMVYWVIPPGIGVLAVALRGFALGRWRTIDWLRFRAPRKAGAVRGPMTEN
jgi:hypothetical protein